MNALDVRPLKSLVNVRDRASRDAVLFGDDSVKPCIRSNLQDLGFGEDGARVFCTFHNCLTALRNHVRHILGMSAEEKVIDVDARRNVASVADMETFGDWAPPCFPREPMSAARPALPIGNQAISGGMNKTRPKSATIWAGFTVEPQAIRERGVVRNAPVRHSDASHIRDLHRGLVGAVAALVAPGGSVILAGAQSC